MKNLPAIIIPSNLSEQDQKIARLIINSKTGCLRASCPTLPKKIRIPDNSMFGHYWDYKDENDTVCAKAAYVWRMVAFFVSPISQHQCMPVTAEFYIGGNITTRNETIKQLDQLVDKIVDCIPADQWCGVARWRKALGY